MLVSMPQLMASLGIVAGYFTSYGSIHIDSSISWRLPFILMAAVAVLLVVSCFYLPDSPRWLLLHGRREQALHEIERLEVSRVEAEKDILTSQLSARPNSTSWKSLLLMFQPQYRFKTILGLFVLGMVQLSGIDGVLYVSHSSPFCQRLCANFLANNSTLPFYSPKLACRAEQPHSLLPASLHSLCSLSPSLPSFTPTAGVGGLASYPVGSAYQVACLSSESSMPPTAYMLMLAGDGGSSSSSFLCLLSHMSGPGVLSARSMRVKSSPRKRERRPIV